MMKRPAYNIPNIHDSLRQGHRDGKLTIEQVANEYFTHGHRPYIDLDYAVKKITPPGYVWVATLLKEPTQASMQRIATGQGLDYPEHRRCLCHRIEAGKWMFCVPK